MCRCICGYAARIYLCTVDWIFFWDPGTIYDATLDLKMDQPTLVAKILDPQVENASAKT